MFGPVHPWDRSNDETAENLRQAMLQNPYLNLMVQSAIMMVLVIIQFKIQYVANGSQRKAKRQNDVEKDTNRNRSHMMYLQK
jgi:hypothetical protein